MGPLAFASDVGTTFATTAFSGSMLLAVPVAILAGLVSFASPCVLPLLPGYVGYVSGLAASNAGATAGPGGGGSTSTLTRAPARWRVAAGVALFVAGFALVFVLFMAAAGAVGVHLKQWEDVITRVLGVFVILMGFAFMGAVPFLQRERRMHLSPTSSLWGAPLLGIVFGIGWAPCIGPTLTAVMALSLDEATVGRGAILGVAYSLGLGVPFLLIGIGLERSKKAVAFLRRHRLVIMRLGGGMLILIGLALVTGVWGALTGQLAGWIGTFETVI
ncbi:cytochrome c biogenesis CcdA family protein [Oerskovia turbata]